SIGGACFSLPRRAKLALGGRKRLPHRGGESVLSVGMVGSERGLRLLVLSAVSLLGAKAGGEAAPRLTPAPAGPYQVNGNRILDTKGRPYLVRGTELPALTLNPADIAGDGVQFGAFSASSLISIRQRLKIGRAHV